MCLIVPEDGKIEKAKKNIKVYKGVLDFDDETGWRSPCFFTHFDYNKVETARDGKTPIEHLSIKSKSVELNCKGRINEGFHSMLKKEDVDLGEIVCECIIPKGSEYCIGRDGDVVSVKLIVFETWFDYVVFKLKSIWRDIIGIVGCI